MGTVILTIAAVIEIIFGIYCFKRKSNEKKMRNIIRISTFIVFFLFILLSIIQWSFQWKPLAVILFIWSVISVISLVRRRECKKQYRTSRIIIKGLSMWVTIFLAVSPALIFPQYKLPETTGKYKIKAATYTFKDNNRIDTFSNTNEKREGTAEFWYPEEATGKCPLVIFSHGAFGVKTSNTSTFNELASNGYVVCSIDHPHHSLITVNVDKKVTMVDKNFMKEVNDVNNDIYDAETEYKLQQNWLKVRTDDINFIIDTILQKVNEGNSDKVYQLIDTSKIGLIGHSLGGAASAQVGRERNDIGAIINLDADLLGEYIGFENGRCRVNDKIYTVPILSIYSDDMKRLYEKITDPDIIIPQRLILATAPNSFEVYFEGTNHMSFTDLPIVSPLLTRMISSTAKNKIGKEEADKYYVIEKMNDIALEFFDCYLKQEGSFKPEDKY
ncbi:alpha/beta hydrolase family protein [Clostridium cellulovorans]|uniref:Platelet-activating factor acetylhydrolase, plasma/intracellular isoform II n=1 Tax=Clostridium cellulovorans (strain ATCC 35296 / DSM 3052 / OCM 3 / 743B) TaxID=573061 RepID=D9SV48_CLOC7|nr:acetylhydrolase [Clostridium cellulovorans]ADL53022.1 platelet-activating factor acetylhydrolase, plasma/intracellular isoform II [Clostridium cellulovorans 743B]